MRRAAPAAAPAAAAPAAAPAAAAPAPAAAAAPGDYSAAASGLLAGSALETAISNICEMGFPREEVRRVPMHLPCVTAGTNRMTMQHMERHVTAAQVLHPTPA